MCLVLCSVVVAHRTRKLLRFSSVDVFQNCSPAAVVRLSGETHELRLRVAEAMHTVAVADAAAELLLLLLRQPVVVAGAVDNAVVADAAAVVAVVVLSAVA